MTDAELGAALRRAGLSDRMLAAAWGTAIAAHVPRVARELPPGPATAALRLLVAGDTISVPDAERGLGPAYAALRARDFLVDAGGEDATAYVFAPVSIVPVGASLICCDRNTTWPDDSSHHLVGCVPPDRVGRWLDVGTGCGIVPLARRDRARTIVATDLDPQAVAHARFGAGLSAAPHLAVIEADLAADAGAGFELVTFNLPIPAEAGLTGAGDSLFRRAPPGANLLARFVAEIPARITAGATIVLHAWLGPAIAAIVDDLAGEVTVVRYTPDHRDPFAIVRWRPDAPTARRAGQRVPTGEAPHLTWDDLESATSH